MKKKLNVIVIVAIALLIFTFSANANNAIILDDFEAYTIGDPIIGQGDWIPGTTDCGPIVVQDIFPGKMLRSSSCVTAQHAKREYPFQFSTTMNKSYVQFSGRITSGSGNNSNAIVSIFGFSGGGGFNFGIKHSPSQNVNHQLAIRFLPSGDFIYGKSLIPGNWYDFRLEIDWTYTSSKGKGLACLKYKSSLDHEWLSDSNVCNVELTVEDPTKLDGLKVRMDGIGSRLGEIDNILVSYDYSHIVIDHVSPTSQGQGDAVDVRITGAGYEPGTTVVLVNANDTEYAPTQIEIDSPTQITATFDLSAVSVGLYDVVATNALGTDTLTEGFEVLPGGEARLETRLVLPGSLGRHAVATLWVEYKNSGTVGMPAPLLVVKSADPDDSDKPILTLDPSRIVQNLWTSTMPQGTSHSVQFFADGSSPGILEAGETGRVPVYYVGLLQPWNFSDTKVEFEVRVVDADNSSPLDWDTREAWDAIFPNFSTAIGNTWGDYLSMASTTQSFLSRHSIGFNNKAQPDLDALFDYVANHSTNTSPINSLSADLDIVVDAPGIPLSFARAFPTALPDRLFRGWLGTGWHHSWVKRLTEMDNGDVILLANGTPWTYQPDSRGDYFSPRCDFSTSLKRDGDGFVLRYRDGTEERYGADGWLVSLTDPNGNQVTTQYDGEKLTRLVHSSGQSLNFSYDGDRLTGIADHTSTRSVTYGYDADSRLASVTDTTGITTLFTYETSGPAEGALKTITHADGRVESVVYDANGRLLTVSLNGDEILRLDYSEIGLVKLTAVADGSTEEYYYGLNGELVKFKDPLEQVVQNQFDADSQLTRTIRPDGLAGGIIYDQNGNPIKVYDPRYELTRFTFDDHSRMTSITDARNNKSQYSYDAAGNLERITFPDESYESANYDAHGNLTVAINRRGQSSTYSYNADGQVTRKVYPDSSTVDYVYDTAGNLIEMTDTTGITQFTYYPTHLLKRITYPSGRFLEFTYDTAGRRTSSIDHLGYHLRYSYNDHGLLDKITHQIGDGTETELVDYDYDAKDRLVKKTLGNGVYTTYEYDLSNQLKRLTNYAPDDSVLSFFSYAYDNLGRRTGMQATDGNWTYGYDLVGQLTSAVFESTNPDIPSRDISYTYDAVGNRITETVDGVTTNYVTNAMNQYTQVGDATYTYDADGNLVSKTEGVDVWSYSYDIENRLIGVTGPDGTTEFEYDGLGNLVAVIENGVRTEYMLDPAGFGDLVGEYSANGALRKRYNHGLGLVSQNDSFFTFDGNGNTSELVTQDGGHLNHYVYEPFGARLYRSETIGTDFQFVGQAGIRPESVDLEFMRNRFYDPSIGRFISEDPIGLDGEDPNLYRYVKNDPVRLIDPNGFIDSIGSLPPPGPDGQPPKKLQQSSNLQNIFGEPTEAAKQKVISDKWEEEELKKRVKEIHNKIQGKIRAMGRKIGSIGRSVAKKLAKHIIRGGGRGGLPGVIVSLIGEEALAYGLNNTDPGRNLTKWAVPKYACIFPSNVTVVIFFVDMPADELARFCEKLPDEPDTNNASTAGEQSTTDSASSRDPNALTGPKGVGDANYITADTLLAYRIDFENDAEATAPAQIVEITNQLAESLDWLSVRLTEIGFGEEHISVPADSAQAFETRVPMDYEGVNFEVEVRAGINTETGEVYATFYSYLPDSELPPPVEIGFLPPEDGTGRGMGQISYTVDHDKGLADGIEIRNIARIVFDQGEEIYTNQVDPHDPGQGTDPSKEALVTIDALVAHSKVAPLPAVSPNRFTVHWSGTDSASGVAGYNIFVREGEDQPWNLWLNDTSANYAVFLGDIGKTYRFYSIATDRVGHIEQKSPLVEAETLVDTLAADLVLTGVIDGPLTGGTPKAIEIKVLKDVADLSIYGFGSANDGGSSDGEEFSFPAVSATAGDVIYVATESTGFMEFFGLAPDYTSAAANVDGNDAIELFKNGSVVDVFGDINVDGTGEPWEYTDGWAYRLTGTGPDGTTFVFGNWTFSGPDALDGEVTNGSAATPLPIGTYLPVNEPPQADAGADQQVTIRTDVNLDGSNSSDPNGDLLSYSWTFILLPPESNLNQSDLSGSNTASPYFTPDVAGNYTLQLTVSDGYLSDSDEVLIQAQNIQPLADAGMDQNVERGTEVMLDGSNSFDPDDHMITFEWNIDAKPAESTLINDDITDRKTPSPSFMPDVDGTYTLRLTVNNGYVNSEPDYVDIKAKAPNVPPNANAGKDKNAYTGNSIVVIDGSGSNDPDNGPSPLTYSWTFKEKPAESGLQDSDIVDANQVQASFIPDVDGNYLITLRVYDGEGSDEDDVVVIASTSNVKPNADAGKDQEVALGNKVILEVILNGTDSNDPDNSPAEDLSFSWRFVSVANGSSLTNNADIFDVTTATPRFRPDVAGSYVLEVEVFDGLDNDFDNVMITVISNSAPHTAPSGGGIYEINDEVTLGGNVSDYDGDLLEYRWMKGTDVLCSGSIDTIKGGEPVELLSCTLLNLSLGEHPITLQVDDGINAPVSSGITVKVIDTGEPTLSPVSNEYLLWPPNHQMVDIVIEANASDNSGLPVTLAAVVTSNEPVNGLGDGDMEPDWTEPVIDQDTGIIEVQLRAERSGSGDGRIYTISITAIDTSDNSSTTDVEIIVPHDKGKKK